MSTYSFVAMLLLLNVRISVFRTIPDSQETASTNQTQTFSTFVDTNGQSQNSCRIFANNDQFVELTQLRQQNLKLEKTLSDLQVLIKTQQNCPAQDVSALREIELLKNQISSLMVKVDVVTQNQGVNGNNNQELLVLLRALQTQSNSLMQMTQQLVNRVPQSNCAEIQSLIQTENANLERKLTDLWKKYDSLMQTNQELNQFIIQLQGDKQNMSNLTQQIQNNQISLSQLRTENANLIKLIQDLKNGNNTEQLFAQVRAVSQENGKLQQELINCNQNNNTNEELKVLRNQNQQLQGLVQQLGTQLFEQAKQYKQEQEYENQIAILKAQVSTLQVQLQKESDTVVMLTRESQSTTTMMNSRFEDLKVDLDVCKSSSQTLQSQLRESQTNQQSMANLMTQNKSLSDNLTECRSLNSNLQGQRDQLNIINVDLTKCKDQSQEMNRQLQNLNANLTRAQTQRDEFQVQVSQMSSIKAQLDNCSNNIAQLRESNANLSNFQRRFEQLEGQIGDRNTLLQQINVLRSEKNMTDNKCSNDLKKLETDFNTTMTELSACKQANQAIQVTIQNLKGNDNEVQNLRNQNAQLNQRFAEVNARAQSCLQQVSFLNSVETELKKSQNELKGTVEQISALRNQLTISNNDRSKCQLEVAQVTELQRRLKVMDEDNNQLNAVTQQINELSKQIDNQRGILTQSDQRYQEIRVRFDQCFSQQNDMNSKLDQCQNKLSLTENNLQKLQRDLEANEAGNTQMKAVAEENRTLAQRVQALQQNLNAINQRCGQLDAITVQLNTCNQSRNNQEGLLSKCQQDQEQYKLRMAQLEAQNGNLGLLQNQINQKDVLIANLTKQNESFVSLQRQINEYVNQLREKQTVELRNTQLQKDLDNLKAFSDREINRLNAQLEQTRGQVNSCTESSKTLQTQLISVRTESQGSQNLQNEYNVCQETLKNARNEITLVNAQIRELSAFQGRLEATTNQLNQTKENLRQCSNENKQFATTIQSLQLQVSTIPNLQNQIQQLNSQVTDYKTQNETLRNLERKLQEIQNVQNQTQTLNSELRTQIQTNLALKEQCEKENAQVQISLNTMIGEKQASDRIVQQLRLDLQRFGNSQNDSQSQVINENTTLKTQLAVISQQLQDCKNQNVNLTNGNNQLTRVQVELQNCQSQAKQLQDNNQTLNLRVQQMSALQQKIDEQVKQIDTLKSEISNYERIQQQLQQFQVSLNQNVQLNSQIQNLRDQLAQAQRALDQTKSNFEVQVTKIESNLQSCEQNNAQLQKNVENLSSNNNVIGNLQNENRTLTQRVLALTLEGQNCQRELSVTQRIQQERDNCLNNLKNSQTNLEQAKQQNVNLLIQVNTIPQLNNRISTLDEQLKESNARNQQLNQLTIQLNSLRTAATERDQFSQNLQRCEQEKASMQQQFAKQTSDLRLEITTIRTNFDNCRQSSEGLGAQITQLTQRQPEINKLQEERSQLNNQVIQLTSSNRSLTERVNQLTLRTTECQKLQEEINSANQNISTLRVQINNQQNQLNNCVAKDQQINTLNQEIQQLKEVRDQNLNLRNQLQAVSQQNTLLTTTVTTIRTESQNLSSQLQNCQQSTQGQLGQLQNELQSSKNTVQQLNGRIVVLNNDNDNLKSQLQTLNQRVESSTSSTQNLSVQIRDLQGQNSQLQLSSSQKDSRIQALIVERDQITVQLTNCQQSQQNTGALQSQISLIQRRQSELEDRLATCNVNLQTVQSENRTLTVSVQDCNTERANLRTQLNESLSSIQSLQLNLNNSQKRISTLQSENTSLNGRVTVLSSTQSEITACNNQKQTLSQEVNKLTSNNQSLIIQIEQLRILNQNCDEVRKQRDLYANTLISFQNRLTSFKDNVLVRLPENNNNPRANTTSTTTTITRSVDGGEPQIMSFNGSNENAVLSQQLAMCQSQLAQFSSQTTLQGTTQFTFDSNVN